MVDSGTYSPKYTSFERLQLELAGRLKIIPDTGTATFPDNSLSLTIAPELVLNKLEIVEAKVEGILGQVYCLPFSNKQPIVISIVEEWTIAELLNSRYFGAGLGNTSTDISNLASNAQNEANNWLLLLTVGYNIAIPGVSPQQRDQFNRQARRIELPGETLNTNIDQQPVLVNNLTVIGKSEKTPEQSLYDPEYDRCNPFSENYRERRYP